jgi:uncharacterized protein YfaA (DUF2138 family)
MAGAAVIVVAVAAFFGWHAFEHHQRIGKPIPAALFDIAPIRLAQPDALLVSTRLRDLPRDMLSVPLLKALLTEDFVFYYDDNDGLLSLKGTLRRIAYEHQLTLGDEVIALALDQPADIALWQDPSGRLAHWMINAQRNGLTALLQTAAQVAAGDPQLTLAGTLHAHASGDKSTFATAASAAATNAASGTTSAAAITPADIPVYSLRYGAGRTLYFAGQGDKLIVFSDLAMIDGDDPSYGPAPDRNKVWEALLNSHWQVSPLRRHFGLGDFTGKHAIVAETAYLSFHYQHFFPSVEALRFDFDGKRWASYARLEGGTPSAPLDTHALWQHVPASASFCSAMPVDPARLTPVLTRLFDDADSDNAAPPASAVKGAAPSAPKASPTKQAAVQASATVLRSHLVAPAALCWYPQGGLYSPLLVAHLKDVGKASDAVDTALQALFSTAIGNKAHPSTVAQRNADTAGARQWQRAVHTDFGTFNVTLARDGEWLAFSPSSTLVDNAQAVWAKQRPALADTLPSNRPMAEVVITPRTLSALLQQAILGDLPAHQEPLLRAAAQDRLLPRINAIADFPPVALTLPDNLADGIPSSRTWQPIEWQTFSDAH